MKGYYIPFGARSIVSINKKIDMQKEQLSKLGAVEEVDVKIAPKSVIRQALSVFPFVDLPWDYSEAYDKIKNPDYIYMRRTGADRKFIKFLKNMRSQYPKCKLICEIPTYPYIGEMLQSYRGWLFIVKELYNRRKLKKYVDRFVTYSADDNILGVPTIRTKNGIDVASIKPVTARKRDGMQIDMIAVAVMRKCHGYERVIKGIQQYYNSGGTRNIILHLVGDGSEKQYYEKLVQKYNLSQHVIFYGRKIGKELDEIYEKADIALSMFGLYKGGIEKISSLKANEYLAKGLPVVSGCREAVFENKQFEYYYEFENDASIIDMQKIIDFCDEIYGKKTKEEVVREIRKFAFQQVDMGVTMNPLLDYIVDMRDDKKPMYI